MKIWFLFLLLPTILYSQVQLTIKTPQQKKLWDKFAVVIEIKNTSANDISNVYVQQALPVSLKYLASNLPNHKDKNIIKWHLGTLTKGTTKRYLVHLEIAKPGNINHMVELYSGQKRLQEKLFSLKVHAPQVTITKEGPKAIQVGEPVEYILRLTNTGTIPLNNFLFQDEVPSGMRSLDNYSNPVTWKVKDLYPQETEVYKIVYVAEKIGKYTSKAQVILKGEIYYQTYFTTVISSKIENEIVGEILGKHKQKITTIAFHPNGKIIASGSFDRTIKLWSLADKKVIRIIKAHTWGLKSIVFSPDGKLLASASDDKTAKLWEVKTGKLIDTFKEHTFMVADVAFYKNSLATASWDKTIRIRSLDRQRKQMLNGHLDWVHCLVFGASGTIIYSGSQDKTIRSWFVETGSKYQIFKGHTYPIVSMALSSDGKTLASASEMSIRFWDIETGNKKLVIASGANSIAFSPIKNILANGRDDGTVWLLDIKTGKVLFVLKKHDARVLSVAFSPDGKILATASADKTIVLWRLN